MTFVIKATDGRAILQHVRETIFGGQLPGTSLDVFIQDQVTSPFHYYLMNELKDDITLTAPIDIGDTVIGVSTGHGFSVATGTYMVGRGNGSYFQEPVMAVSGDDITVASPIGVPFAVDDTQIIRGNVEMNLDASGADTVFRCAVSGDVPVDIQAILVTMQHPTAGDDSKFGDLAAITDGMLIQKVGDVPTQPISITFFRNQDFREFGSEVDYTEKAGGGNHSTNIFFDVKKYYGIVIRLDPRLNDCFRGTIRDDLSDLLRLRIAAMGQLTQGE